MLRYAFAALFCAVILGDGQTVHADEAPVSVGSIEVLSGPNAHYGMMIKDGLDLALDEINGSGGVLGGRKINLVMEDSAGNKDQGDQCRASVDRPRQGRGDYRADAFQRNVCRWAGC